MIIYTLTKKGRNIELKVTDTLSGAIISYFVDSANFEAIFNSGNILTFNLFGYITFTTLNVLTNNCLYIDTGTGAVLIPNKTIFETNYELLFT